VVGHVALQQRGHTIETVRFANWRAALFFAGAVVLFLPGGVVLFSPGAAVFFSQVGLCFFAMVFAHVEVPCCCSGYRIGYRMLPIIQPDCL